MSAQNAAVESDAKTTLLLDQLCALYVRACEHDSKELHDAWVQARTEFLSQLRIGQEGRVTAPQVVVIDPLDHRSGQVASDLVCDHLLQGYAVAVKWRRHGYIDLTIKPSKRAVRAMLSASAQEVGK